MYLQTALQQSSPPLVLVHQIPLINVSKIGCYIMVVCELVKDFFNKFYLHTSVTTL